MSIIGANYSRSLISGAATSNIASKSLVTSATAGANLNPALQFPASVLQALNTIELSYARNMQNKAYAKIPTDLNAYLSLLNTVSNLQRTASNVNLALLFKLVQESLTSAINGYSLYYQNTELNVQNILLQTSVNDILSNKNEKNAIATTSGQLSITKTFTMAPLFSYYIMLYGVPAFGVGFDPNKLSTLLMIFSANGLNPYA